MMYHKIGVRGGVEDRHVKMCQSMEFLNKEGHNKEGPDCQGMIGEYFLLENIKRWNTWKA